MIVLPVLFYPLMCKQGRYGRVFLSRASHKRRHSTGQEVRTLLKLRVSAAITKVALSYLKGRNEIHHATTKTVCTQDKMAQRESEQLDRVPYENKGSYGNPGPITLTHIGGQDTTQRGP